MERDYLLVPVDTKEGILLDFGLIGIRPVLQAMEETQSWLGEARKGAPLAFLSMLNNGLRMEVNIRASLAEFKANPDNVYFGSMESLTEHCGVKVLAGWSQPLSDAHNAFLLMPAGSVRLAVTARTDAGYKPLSVEIPAGFFPCVQKYIATRT